MAEERSSRHACSTKCEGPMYKYAHAACYFYPTKGAAPITLQPGKTVEKPPTPKPAPSAHEFAANEMQKKAAELQRYKNNREQSDKNEKKTEEGKVKKHEA